ncbi:MAG: ABATE domain-containing protein [Actinomycetia bacterium]|nr:ABATE domain-containing protein [Actinomycetes bacterium]
MNFAYVSGSAALDLAATVESRRDGPVDLLRTPADLERWVGTCAGLPDRVSADEATFTTALALRESIYDLALDRVRGRSFESAALATVNAAANGPMPTLHLADAGVHLSGGLDSALTQLARDGIAVLADPDATLKECGRPACTRIYLDRSRGSRRTWCGMDECGNRVKAAAYRARKRAADGFER